MRLTAGVAGGACEVAAGSGFASRSVMATARVMKSAESLLRKGSEKGWVKGAESLVWLLGVRGSVGSLAVDSSSSAIGESRTNGGGLREGTGGMAVARAVSQWSVVR